MLQVEEDGSITLRMISTHLRLLLNGTLGYTELGRIPLLKTLSSRLLDHLGLL
jgi:hypothetical protein